MNSLLSILPTALKVEDSLKRASRANGCQMGHRVMTFPQLVEALWRESRGRSLLIGPIGERLVIAEACRRVPVDRGAAQASPGLEEHLLGLARQLKRAALTPADLREAIATTPGPESLLETYVAVISEYERILAQRNVADAHDRERGVLEMLIQLSAQHRRPRLLEGVERILVAEIYDFSALQFMIIAALIGMIGDATLTIQAVENRVNAARFAELTWNRFVGEESIANQVLPEFVRRDGRQGRLGFVIANLFTGDYPQPPPLDDTVSIVETPNRQSEVEEIARAIRRNLEAPPATRIALERIAIVARDLEPYADHLDSVFRRYRIPLRGGMPSQLRATPPARFVMDLLRAPIEGYRREAIVALCNNSLVRVAAYGFRGLLADVGYIDRETRPLADCIRQHLAALDDGISEAGRDRRATDKARIDRRRAAIERGGKAWLDFIGMIESLETTASIADHVERLRTVLGALRFDPARSLRGAAQLTPDASTLAAGPLDQMLTRLVSEAEAIAPDRLIDLEEFAALLDAVLRDAVVETGAPSVGGVTALPVLEARGLDFDLVFVIGLIEGEFPRYHREDPLISDDLRWRLNRPLAAALRRRMGANAPDSPGPILRTSRDRNAEDWFLFFLALSMPEWRLVLSYPLTDERGNPQLRSQFVAEVARLLGDDRESDSRIVRKVGGERVVPEAADCFARSEFLNRAVVQDSLSHPASAEIISRDQLDSIAHRTQIERARELYFSLPTREALFEEQRQTSGGDGSRGVAEILSDGEKMAAAGRWDGHVTSDERLRRYVLEGTRANPRHWSPSQLSVIAACGFRYFASRVLKLDDDDEPGYERSALETGSAVHEVLGDLFARRPDWSGPAAANRIVDKVLDQAHGRMRLLARDEVFFDLDWRRVERMVRELVAREIAHTASGAETADEIETEFEFNLELRASESVPRTESMTWKIGGRIDRLELFHNGGKMIHRVRVIDYKTSKNLDRYAQLLEPSNFATRDLQIPVYALAARAGLAARLAADATIEGSYIALASREKEIAIPISPELLETDPARRAALSASGFRTIADRILELIESAAAGRFDVDPLACDEYCAYRAVCRYRKAFNR